MQSPQRRAEHRAAANQTRRDTDATNEWARARGIQLQNLDGDDASPSVLAVPREMTNTPTNFTVKEFSFDAGLDELEAHYVAGGDDVALAILDHRLVESGSRDRAQIRAELTGSARNGQRHLKAGNARLRANIQQVVGQMTDVPERAEEMFAFVRSLSDEAQHEIAARVQRESDLRLIEKIGAGANRKPTLKEGRVRVLDAIGRNNPMTRGRVASLPVEDQDAALADLVAEWRRDCRRVRAKEWRNEHRFQTAIAKVTKENVTALSRAWDATPHKERVNFIESTATASLDIEALA